MNANNNKKHYAIKIIIITLLLLSNIHNVMTKIDNRYIIAPHFFSIFKTSKL